MRTITTTTGVRIPLDGDLLAIIETLFQEVTAKRQLDRSYEDMMREIRHLIGQMTDSELRDYLAESLFHNTVRFENERLAAYMQKLATSGKRHR
jgi:phage gp29-like protein